MADIYEEDNAVDFVSMSDEELESYLMHFGTKRHSGRYPWGSGDNPYQRSEDFLARVEQLKKEGLKEKAIADSVGVSSTRLRVLVSLAKSERRADLVASVKSLKGDGLSNVEIANRLGIRGESTVRSLLNEDSMVRMNIAQETAQKIQTIVDEKGMVDIGVGVARELGISQDKFNQAIEILRLDGYEVWAGRVPQSTNKGLYTTLKVLGVPGTAHKDIYDYGKIGTITEYNIGDDGKPLELKGFKYPASLDSNRIQIRYADEGGAQKDGIVELRRGVPDISLGMANYSQVRILVDGTHYIKGMAVYSDNLPDGVDVMFYTNKGSHLSKLEVLKPIKDDPDNPFGSNIKEIGGQSYFTNSKGEPQLSVINKRADEGDWGDWSKELSSQFLSKQPNHLIKQQLNLSLADKKDEYDEISKLTNPTVKRALLESFADDMDASAVHLKAASLPGTTYKVILPISSLKDSEVYAPHLREGSQVALVRYPHGGTFEIPLLTVNNHNKEGREVLTPQPRDAIGINSKVAERLSGADFDGDTVMVIPIGPKSKVTSTRALKELEGFDTKLDYGPSPDGIKIINGQERYFRGTKEYKVMAESSEQLQMGSISNLITDMTLKGATESEIARAVKHSMVVIDSVKHHLDYRQSEKDNNIQSLKEKYQSQVGPTGKVHFGASTLISKASSEERIPERKEGAFFARDTGNPLTLIETDGKEKLFMDNSTGKVYTESEKRTRYIDPITGEKLYHETGRVYLKTKYTNPAGKQITTSVVVKDGVARYKDEDGMWIAVTPETLIIYKTPADKSTKMAEVKDAHALSSGTVQENLYADYANELKGLANQARLDTLSIVDIPYSKSAYDAYKEDVISINHKLNIALLNAPKERQAQTIAASVIKAKKQANPRLTSEQIRKIETQELAKARAKTGAKKNRIELTPNEWIAIQAGAISASKLKQIMANADLDVLRALSMPRATTVMSEAKIRRINNLANSGYTSAEIAEALGISSSTVSKYLKGGS